MTWISGAVGAYLGWSVYLIWCWMRDNPGRIRSLGAVPFGLMILIVLPFTPLFLIAGVVVYLWRRAFQ